MIFDLLCVFPFHCFTAPAGCPLERSVHPWIGCGLRAQFTLGDAYSILVSNGDVRVSIRFSPGVLISQSHAVCLSLAEVLFGSILIVDSAAFGKAVLCWSARNICDPLLAQMYRIV